MKKKDTHTRKKKLGFLSNKINDCKSDKSIKSDKSDKSDKSTWLQGNAPDP